MGAADQKIREESSMPTARIQRRLREHAQRKEFPESTFDSIDDRILESDYEDFKLQKSKKELGVK